jgi:hypothetical protein
MEMAVVVREVDFKPDLDETFVNFWAGQNRLWTGSNARGYTSGSTEVDQYPLKDLRHVCPKDESAQYQTYLKRPLSSGISQTGRMENSTTSFDTKAECTLARCDRRYNKRCYSKRYESDMDREDT